MDDEVGSLGWTERLQDWYTWGVTDINIYRVLITRVYELLLIIASSNVPSLVISPTTVTQSLFRNNPWGISSPRVFWDHVISMMRGLIRRLDILERKGCQQYVNMYPVDVGNKCCWDSPLAPVTILIVKHLRKRGSIYLVRDFGSGIVGWELLLRGEIA